MRVVLITGTSSGIGLETAVQAAKAGYRVIATMRNLEKQAALRDAAPDLDIRQLDVVDDTSVISCIEGVVADFGQLDAVINNAGAGHVGTIELSGIEEFRRVMELNYFGVVRVTQAAMPHLRRTRGRLITISSAAGVLGQPFNEAYGAAKFAVEGMMESLASVAGRLGVQVSVVEPGPVSSEFVSNVMANTDVDDLFSRSGDYAPLLTTFAERIQGEFAEAQSSQEAAEVVVRALADERPNFRYQTSEQVTERIAVKLRDLDGAAVQEQSAKRLT